VKLLLTGATGQLGTELQRRPLRGWEVVAVGRGDVDICDFEPTLRFVREQGCGAVVNAAAYTAVDKAESEPEAARAVNVVAAENLARAAAEVGARFIHISTDYVFDGTKGSPYQPCDATHPLSVYGATKLEAEQAVLRATDGKALILRTSWLYSTHGHNFVKTMLRLMGERERLGIVADQIGTPTWAATLAAAIERALERPEICGLHHWTDAGVASWYDFAVAIRDEARAVGLLDKTPHIAPIGTADFPTPATRPLYSVLDKSATWRQLDWEPAHWRESLANMLKEIKETAAHA
jgi:dTDP-4-dehydrorhamnose reductase